MIYTNNLLQGARIHLAAIRQDDLATYNKWYTNTEFRRLLSARAVRLSTLESQAEWLKNIAKDEKTYYFGIRSRDDDHLLGNCHIEIESQPSRHGWVSIYIGEPDDWGKGYGTEAMGVLVRFGFMELNLHRISLNVFSYNERGMKSYEKVGFVHEGTTREALYRDGTYHDIHVMGILRHNWMAKHHPEVK
ncbi:MAG: GNAT family protein [bacterium]|nr:GNAT family protein [bacterium]